MIIKNENVASCGYPNYEFRGTISIDFANNDMTRLPGLDLSAAKYNGWNIVALKLGTDFIEKEKKEVINIDFVLSSYVNGVSQHGFVSKEIVKQDLINLIKIATIQVSDTVHFEKDEIAWKDLNLL